MKIVRGYQEAVKLLQRELLPDITAESGGSTGSVEDTVRGIIASVRRQGDGALYAFTEHFDGARLKSLEVTPAEIKHALKSVDPELLKTLRFASARIERFHKSCLRRYGKSFIQNGLGQQVSPLEKVGIYVPGGTAAYPSTVLMTVVPARVAGVGQIIMCTPCGRDGRVPLNTLSAAHIAGVDKVFKIGGAQAVAAMAYGTQSVPRVDKICGPGNIWVMTAKKLVYGAVDIDALQGPSEVVVIADSSADPAFCAADLIAQSEHDAMAVSVFITTSMKVAENVQRELDKQLAALKRSDIARRALDENGIMVIVRNISEAIDLANLFAPEHLALMIKGAGDYIGRIRHAGCICAGQYSPVVLGDYVAGPSHALPTGGSARFSSPLMVQDFLKTSSIIALDDDKIRQIGPHARLLAQQEGLTGHAHAIKLRLNKKR